MPTLEFAFFCKHLEADDQSNLLRVDLLAPKVVQIEGTSRTIALTFAAAVRVTTFEAGSNVRSLLEIRKPGQTEELFGTVDQLFTYPLPLDETDLPRLVYVQDLVVPFERPSLLEAVWQLDGTEAARALTFVK